MGRIVASVRIENGLDSTRTIQCDALVDTGATHMVLPAAWKDRLGDLATTRVVELEMATQQVVQGEICGPVAIQIQGFPLIHSEVLFLDVQPENGAFEPLIGYLVLEHSQAAVDMMGHRLLPVRRMDLKSMK